MEGDVFQRQLQKRSSGWISFSVYVGTVPDKMTLMMSSSDGLAHHNFWLAEDQSAQIIL